MTKEIIKAKRKVARKENQFYRIYKKDVIKYIRIKKKKAMKKRKDIRFIVQKVRNGK